MKRNMNMRSLASRIGIIAFGAIISLGLARDKMRDSVVVQLHVLGKGFHDDVGFVGVFYGPAGDNAPLVATAIHGDV
jgi:hypothetical protein